MPEVFADARDPLRAACLTSRLLDGPNVAELSPSCLTSLGLRHATGNEALGGLREVRVHLVAHLAFHAPARRGCAEPHPCPSDETHLLVCGLRRPSGSSRARR